MRTAVALGLVLVACGGPSRPGASASGGADAGAVADAVAVAVADAGAVADADAGADAGRGAPRLTDVEALALARRLDPHALGGLSPLRPPDFLAAGFAAKGVLYARASDVGHEGAKCLAIPYESYEGGLSGSISRTWRDGGDVITEGYDLELRWSASMTGPGRTVVHADKTTSTSATGCLTVLGAFREGGAGRLRYDGCAVRVREVSCGSAVEVVHDACPEGPRTCRKCGSLGAKVDGSGHCGMAVMAGVRTKAMLHDCAPCDPDPLGDALPELRRELEGRELVMQASGPSFFAARAACEAPH